MRIKEEIKRTGFFWLPSASGNPPNNPVFGTLLISDGGSIRLELTEPLDSSVQGLFNFNSDNLGRILGHVETDGPVTLDNCYYISNKRSVVHGGLIASDVIGVNRVFTRYRYEEDVSPRFNILTFSVEGIDEWIGISGIEVDPQFENSALTISYNRPEDVTFRLENGMQLQITFAWTPPGLPATKRAEVTQKTFFKLTSQDALKLDVFIAVAQKITAFLCFIMGKIVCLDSMTATSDDLRETYPDGRTASVPVKIYYSTWPYAKDEPAINKSNMLFKFERIRDSAGRVISNWIKDYEQIAPALDLYFLTKAGTLPTMNIQFLTLVQALEAFHRSRSDEMHMDRSEFKAIRRKMLNECPEEHKEWFGIKLLNGNELTLRDRIEKLIEPFDCLIDDERRPELITHIAKTRNSLMHPNKKSEQKAADGVLLQFLCCKMNALFRLQFLKLIGFDEQEIDDIVDKCNL